MLKRCSRCKIEKEINEFYPCRKSKDGLQRECKTCALEIKEAHRRECKERGILNYSQRTRQRLRFEVLRHYGGLNPECSCCGEKFIEFLSIDHVEGGGAEQRKTIGASGLYSWLKKNNFPPGFRVLCHNCNQSIGAYGYCPHKDPEKRLVCPPRIYRVYKKEKYE